MLAELWWLQDSAAHVLLATGPRHGYTGQKKDWKEKLFTRFNAVHRSCVVLRTCRSAELAFCIGESLNPRKIYLSEKFSLHPWFSFFAVV